MVDFLCFFKGTVTETNVIPYNLQGYAVHVKVVDLLEEKSKKGMVDFLNFLIQLETEDLDELDKAAKVFFSSKVSEDLKDFLDCLVVGTVPPKLRVLFGEDSTGCGYTTMVIDGIRS